MRFRSPEFEQRRRQGYAAMLSDPSRKARMQRRVEWDAEMTAELVRLRREKVGMDRIAERVGVNKQTVAKRLDALGMPRVLA